MKISLVCFDLGRVMVRIADGWEQGCDASGVKLPAVLDQPQVMGQVTAECQLHETGKIDNETFDRRVAVLTGLSPAEVAAVSDAWIGQPFEGIGPLVEKVAATSVMTACLSNTNDRHWQIMSGDGPRGLPVGPLDYRFVSQQIGAAKPDEAIYAHAELATGIAPAEIVFFDDAPQNIEAARRRRWQGEQIDTARDPVQQMHDHLTTYGVL